MYFFLQNFSFFRNLIHNGLCAHIPLHHIHVGTKLSPSMPASAKSFLLSFCATEFFLLTVMSYDRYVAICKPSSLHDHHEQQSLQEPHSLVGYQLLIILPPLGLSVHLEFCDSFIDYFFCDASPILKNACSDTWFIEQLVIFCAVLTFIVTLVCIVLSYIYIIRTVLRLPSAQKGKKPFPHVLPT